MVSVSFSQSCPAKIIKLLISSVAVFILRSCFLTLKSQVASPTLPSASKTTRADNACSPFRKSPSPHNICPASRATFQRRFLNTDNFPLTYQIFFSERTWSSTCIAFGRNHRPSIHRKEHFAHMQIHQLVLRREPSLMEP